jgi:cytochrome P450
MAMATARIDDTLIDPGLFPANHGPPHALFDLWREQDPVHWNPPNPAYAPPMPGMRRDKGFWVLTRYKDVFDVSMNQDLFSSHEAGIVVWDSDEQDLAIQRANFMAMLPADHAAVRRVLAAPFMPKALAAITPEIEQLAREIVDGIAPRGECEFVSEAAARLPVYTFCELMGIPPELRERVAELGNAMADVETRGARDVDPMVGLAAIALELAAEKRRNPDGRLMSAMVNDTTLNLSDLSIVQFFMVFAMAGHETTRSSAVHFFQLMSEHPDQYAALREDFDGRIDNAIDEVLRYTSTTTNFRRTATRDTEIGRFRVKAGDKVYLSYAAANRDPAVFEDPHRFDILRSNAKRHLAFGAGPHVCLGARLAKIQLRALIGEVVRRLPDIHPVGEPEWLRSIWFNAIIRMPVAFTPA